MKTNESDPDDDDYGTDKFANASVISSIIVLQIIPLPELEKKMNDYLDQPYTVNTSRPCRSCGSMNFQPYPDGNGAFCGTCHPRA